MSFHQIRKQLTGSGKSVREPATSEDISGVEERFKVSLPTDVKQHYAIMNGADSWTDEHTSWMRFWPVQEWVPMSSVLTDEQKSKSPNAAILVIADYAIECVFYVLDLQEGSTSYGAVLAIGTNEIKQVAGSFSEFVNLVIQDSPQLHCYN
jgi:cell wall assembly regulator SMI1